MLAGTATAVTFLWEISNVTQRRNHDAHHARTEIRYGCQYWTRPALPCGRSAQHANWPHEQLHFPLEGEDVFFRAALAMFSATVCISGPLSEVIFSSNSPMRFGSRSPSTVRSDVARVFMASCCCVQPSGLMLMSETPPSLRLSVASPCVYRFTNLRILSSGKKQAASTRLT
jgi:hypothetical protein